MKEPEEYRRSIVGRGAAGNPKNRFERIEVEPEPEGVASEEAGPETVYLRDVSRSIIARNDSPDIGFHASINPYRGCSHGCVYCMSGDTPILMADGSTRPLQSLRAGEEIYGTTRRGQYRRYTKTRVLAHWSVDKPAYRVTLEDGTTLISGGDHRFLTWQGWKFVTGTEHGNGRRPHLTTNNKLIGTGAFVQPSEKDQDYKQGYLCGLIRGDGHLASYENERVGRVHGNQHQVRLALADGEALLRASEYLSTFEVVTHGFVFQEAIAGKRSIQAIRTSARANVARIRALLAWPSALSASWCKGFLAGVFDAEGSYSGGVLRIPNTDRHIVEHIAGCLEQFGFSFKIEDVSRGRARHLSVVRICGGLREHMRFFHTTHPALVRKRDIEGQALKNTAELRVASIEPLGTMSLFDITTGTGDFIADGVISHNCYARLLHEYLGFSAGLDFESKILVKQNAPELLRRELSSSRWVPQVIAMSVATDCYQPIEKKLQLTRRCLEVLLEFRNPVAVVTKNHLVTRDIDLLSELAHYDAAVVMVSLTTLDEDLRRVMEPRTSRPARRLAAIEALARADIPVGVMVAPVIPGLTDHEIPALLSAAAEAGASFAAYTPVRLPYAVAPLFEDWLERHFPERKEKVLNRIRSMRGGKLNDPRFGTRMRGEGIFAEQISQLFSISCRRAGIGENRSPKLSAAAFRRAGPQPTLFD